MMTYEWDERRAKRAQWVKLATAMALTLSAISVPVAVLLAASPL